MNPATLAVTPNISNPAKPANKSLSQTASKFGAVLDNAISKGLVKTETKQPQSDQSEPSMEQMNVMKDLLQILRINSLSDLTKGSNGSSSLSTDQNSNDEEALMKVLQQILGGDPSSVKGLLSSILSTGLSSNKADNKNDINDNQDLNAQLIGILGTLLTNLGQQSPKVDTLELKKFFSDVSPELVSMLEHLNSLDVKDLVNQDLKGTANLLKLAKFQDLLASTSELSQEAAAVQKEIKKLLDSITGKLEKWVNSQTVKSGSEGDAVSLLENGTNKSLEAVKQLFNAEGDLPHETLNKGLNVKSMDANTQYSGLPFQMTKLEQFVLTAHKNGQPVNAEQFVKTFEGILSKAHFSNVNGMQKLLIRLHPENLGSLRIELIQKDGSMVAKILATTAKGKELLDQQLQGLKQAFVNQGISVEKVEISQSLSTFNAERFTPRDQGQQEQQQQQQQQSQTEDQNDEEETDFTDRFSEALLNIEV